ncbi:hypothetical protein O988_07853 [Pseudogymnoascus sp. VKM F-3808]|nr:hypothetical protein O988_07853 [Pseudogymnoascus sp. VKM F-3808]
MFVAETKLRHQDDGSIKGTRPFPSVIPANGFFIKCLDGMLDVHVNVHEIICRFRIIVDVPLVWRALMLREATLFITETKLTREADCSFLVHSGQRAKGLVSAVLGSIQKEACEDSKCPSFVCDNVFGCYMVAGLNGCTSCYWGKRNAYCSYRVVDPDNAEGAQRTPTTHRSRRNGSSLNLSPTETALLRRVLFEQQRVDGGGGE